MMFGEKTNKINEDIFVEDVWLWSQVWIKEIDCKKCNSADSITISKGKDLSKLIKVLQKLNYKGLPKRLKKSKEGERR